MKFKSALAAACAAALVSCAAQPEMVNDPASYVNPFIGASTSIDGAGVYHGLGKTFPGAATPYGMVQLSPDTMTGGDNAPGYSAEVTSIEGFSFDHMSGTGWYGDLGNFQVMPTTGKLKVIAGLEDGSIDGWRSKYDKDSEQAKAGWYKVHLTDYDIDVQCTASQHCGFLEMTFPQSDSARVQVDLARRIGGSATREYLKVLDDSTVTGWMRCTPETGGWGNGDGKANYTVYFYARLSQPMTEHGFWKADIPAGMRRDNFTVRTPEMLAKVAESEILTGIDELEGDQIGFFTNFKSEQGQKVLLKVALSFVDMEGAKKNFDAEAAGTSFDAAHEAAYSKWNEELGRVRIAGGSEDEKTVFYTALYHTMIDPRLFSDVDGRYPGGDGQIHFADGKFNKRTVFSGWDVYRSQMPLQTIINPEVVSDMLNSLITLADENGTKYFERWEFLNAYSGCMVSNPALSVLADAYMKGIRDFDTAKALEYGENTSSVLGNNAGGWEAGGSGISVTLENAYMDWCLGQYAAALGDQAAADRYFTASENYKNLFDPEIGWFRPKNADGTWIELPEGDPRLDEGYGCVESDPYQQGWFVPHNFDGMVELMGGKDKVIADLDNFFANTPESLLWNNYYNHSNEPVHFVPFFYNKLGQPEKTQKWTRFICKNGYFNAVAGLVGNEDCGQMSAWYVLAASGIHPSCPGDNRFEITSPVFDKIEFQTDSKYASGKKFTIIAHDNSPENIYIKSMKLNGKPYEESWIDWSVIADGGTLELFMGAE